MGGAKGPLYRPFSWQSLNRIAMKQCQHLPFGMLIVTLRIRSQSAFRRGNELSFHTKLEIKTPPSNFGIREGQIDAST